MTVLQLLKAIRWTRVFVYACLISSMCLNILGGLAAKNVMGGLASKQVPELGATQAPARSPSPSPDASTSDSGAVAGNTPQGASSVAVKGTAPSASPGSQSIGQHDSPVLQSPTSPKKDKVASIPAKPAKNNANVKLKLPKHRILCSGSKVPELDPDTLDMAGDGPVPVPETAEKEAPEYAHVVYAADPKEFNAMLVSMTSAIINSAAPELLRFHLLIPAQVPTAQLCHLVDKYVRTFEGIQCDDAAASLSPERTVAFSGLTQAPPQCNVTVPKSGYTRADAEEAYSSCLCGSAQFHVVPFDSQEYDVLTHTTAGAMDRKELLTEVNFARNFLDDLLLPWGVRRAVYLDVDTVVQGDLVRLHRTPLKPGNLMGAVQSCYLHMSYWFNFDKDVVKATMSKKDCYLNAGVYVVDLLLYRENKIQDKIAQLIKDHRKSKIWKYGVHQSSFILALFNNTQTVDSRWNQLQLGWNKNLPPQQLKDAFVLHWNGEKKPWKPDGMYTDKWRPYAVPGVA